MFARRALLLAAVLVACAPESSGRDGGGPVDVSDADAGPDQGDVDGAADASADAAADGSRDASVDASFDASSDASMDADAGEDIDAPADGGVDLIPPNAVTLFVSPLPNFPQVGIFWLATGDDGDSGAATNYLLREISETMTTTIVLPVSGPHQTQESYIRTLPLNTGIWRFEIAAEDEAGNRAPWSSVEVDTSIGIRVSGATGTIPRGSTGQIISIENTSPFFRLSLSGTLQGAFTPLSFVTPLLLPSTAHSEPIGFSAICGAGAFSGEISLQIAGSTLPAVVQPISWTVSGANNSPPSLQIAPRTILAPAGSSHTLQVEVTDADGECDISSVTVDLTENGGGVIAMSPGAIVGPTTRNYLLQTQTSTRVGVASFVIRARDSFGASTSRAGAFLLHAPSAQTRVAFTPTYPTIQAAIDAAAPDDIVLFSGAGISLAAPLAIPAGKDLFLLGDQASFSGAFPVLTLINTYLSSRTVIGRFSAASSQIVGALNAGSPAMVDIAASCGPGVTCYPLATIGEASNVRALFWSSTCDPAASGYGFIYVDSGAALSLERSDLSACPYEVALDSTGGLLRLFDVRVDGIAGSAGSLVVRSSILRGDSNLTVTGAAVLRDVAFVPVQFRLDFHGSAELHNLEISGAGSPISFFGAGIRRMSNMTMRDGTNNAGLRVMGGSAVIRDSIFWSNSSAPDIYVDPAAQNVTIEHTLVSSAGEVSDPANMVNGGSGLVCGANGNICGNPFLVPATSFLSVVPLQPLSSPAIDAGSRTATAAGVSNGTTRTDGAPDQGQADLGYHAPVE